MSDEKQAQKSDSQESLAWLSSASKRFGQVSADAEFRYSGKSDDHFSVAETWWFDAIAPEAGFMANFYISMRPNLKICSAGTWMWSGDKTTQLMGDHLNFQVFLPEPEFSENKIRVPEVGLEFEFIEPLEVVRIRYAPPGFSVSADLEVKALTVPVVRSNERHFEQAMWTRGWIEIGGRRIEIDGPSFRDRSWGEARSELPLAFPPIGWLYGVVDNGKAAFNLSGCDDPTSSVPWASTYPLQRSDLFLDGWIWCDNHLRKVTGMAKQTVREGNRLEPKKIMVDFEDEDGVSHRLEGETRSRFNMHFWPNLNSFFSLTEWKLDGLEGYGGAQDYAWPDYCQRFWK